MYFSSQDGFGVVGAMVERAAVEKMLAEVVREDGAVNVVGPSEALSLVVELEMRAGEAAGLLLCAGLGIATVEVAVSAGKVRGVVFIPGAPVPSVVLWLSSGPGETSTVAVPALEGGLVSEESFSRSEMLASEDAVVRASKGSRGGTAEDSSVMFVP